MQHIMELWSAPSLAQKLLTR